MSALLTGLWYLLAAAAVLCSPGVALTNFFPSLSRGKDFFEQLADAAGLSLALTALAGLGFFLVGVHPAPVFVLGGYAFLSSLVLLGLGRRFRRVNWLSWAGALRSGYPILLLLFLSILAWRYYQVRELVLPAWVDSLHHVTIVQVILEQGGVPETLDPYIPVPFYYHFAFHLLAAVFSLLAGLSPEAGVLVFGQALNAVVALAVYRLGKTLWQDWRVAGLAALLVGFVSQMPAYYATWGRYTLLTGITLLPLAMAVSLEIVHQPVTRARQFQLAVLTGGLLLSHYFAALLLALFLILLAIQVAWEDRRQARPWFTGRWTALAIPALAGAIMAAPWIGRAWYFVGEYVNAGLREPSLAAVEQAYFPNYLPYLWRLLGPARSHLLLYLAPAGLAAAALQPRSQAFAAWAMALGLLSLPWGIYVDPFRPDHTVIILFLPVVLLVAAFFIAARDRLQTGQLAVPGALLVSIAVTGMLAWGLRETGSIVNASTILANEADLKALEWIERNTPPEARFFINVTHWQYGIYRGVDGGWWILPLSGRQTLLPPALYTQGSRDYTAEVNAQAKQASQVESCTPQFWDLVRDAGLTHLYLGRTYGPLRPEGLIGCPYLQQIYARDGVSIYQVQDTIESTPFP